LINIINFDFFRSKRVVHMHEHQNLSNRIDEHDDNPESFIS